MTKLRLPNATLCVAALALSSSGCLNDANHDAQTQNGGHAGNGGAPLTTSRGGALNDAGAPSRGGSVGIGTGGGSVAIGGKASAGGNVGVGGNLQTGGSIGVGGHVAVGGRTSTGGSVLTGGTQALSTAGQAGASAGKTGIAGLGSVGGGGSGGVAQSNCRPAPPCPAGWLEYTDTVCGNPLGSPTPIPCSPRGDGLCYQRCTTDADCRDATFPTCGAIWMYNGTDYSRSVSVCVSALTVAPCGS